MSRTAPQSTANTLTPSFSTVSSAAGFQAGDLIYAKDNAYGTIPDNAVASANFPINATVAAARTPYNQTVVNIAESSAYSIGNNGRGDTAALLSNGNIVVVGATVSNGSIVQYVYFRIVDINFTEVVASTQVTGWQALSGCVAVSALTGGGFVICWSDATTYNLKYTIYNNSGTQVLAVTTAPGFSTSTYGVASKPLANGGFVLASANSSNQMQSRTFDSAGTAVSSVQTFGSFNYSSSQPLIVTFADNSFSICGNSGATITVYNFNTLGTFTTSTNVAADFYTTGSYSATKLSDGTILVVYTENASANYYCKAIKYNPSTASVSGLGNLNSGYSYSTTNIVQGLAGGGFVLLSGYYGYGYAYYYLYDNSGSQLTRKDIYGLSGSGYYAYTCYATILESSTYVVIAQTFSNSNYASAGVAGVQMLKASPYTIRSFASNSVQLATVSAAVNGYARSVSTPNSAAFLAATTQTLTTSVTPSSGTSFQLAPYAPTSDSIRTTSMVTMLNGQFIVAYATPTNVKYIVFNADGSVFTQVTVATGSYSGPVSIACLGNGKLVVAYPDTNTQVGISIYSTSYSLLATGNTSGAATGSNINSVQYGFSISAIDNTRFVVGFTNNSSYPQVAVFDDTATLLYSHTPSLGNCYHVRVGGMPGGSFYMMYYYANAGYYYYSNYARSGNGASYTLLQNVNISVAPTNTYTSSAVLLPSGVGACFTANGSTMYLMRFDVNSSSQKLYTNVGTSAGYNNVGLCVGSAGQLVVFRADTSDRAYYLYGAVANQNVLAGNRPDYYQGNSITLSDYNNNLDTFSSAPSITCLYGDSYAFAYRTSSNGLKVGILSTASATYSTTLTAGVTVSNPALVPSQSNGYYLAGVSASACVAGGTGVIQTNGSATLNSQYPAGTTSQAFDFTSPTVPVGVKGTIAGRNLTIQGS